MNYPDNIEEKLGFDIIRGKIKAYCQGPRGMAMVEKARFTDNFSLLQTWLGQAEEFMRILSGEEHFPEGHYLDIGKSIRKLEIEGYFLMEHELHEVRLSMRTAQAVLKFLRARTNEYILLNELFRDIDLRQDLIREIERILDEDGNMRSNASVQLLDIDARISRNEREVSRKAQSMFKMAKKEGWTPDLDISVRDGRIVLPIIAEHKRKIKGVVHDESASGQILYIEPAEVMELNNELRELQLQRRREIERILREITAFLSPYAPQLELYNQKLGVIDFIRAKALFARYVNGCVPKLENRSLLDFRAAYHPVLWINHNRQNIPTVPLNLQMEEEDRILVISGPNAGGKSVALKTTGLLQYMLQCGFPIPVREDSIAGIFQQLFIDIGDEQSLDNDLSTYSSHLKNMKHFVNFANARTLILIDEFGTGTDPQFGGPMAEAILEELNSKKCMGVVTTHYSNLKLLANSQQGLVNGAMAYDTEQLMPLYKLEIGKPGSSFAFEVAQKIGLNRKIIDRARKKVGRKQQDVDELLVSLEKERNDLAEQRKRAAEKEQHFEKLRNDYEGLKSDIASRKNDIVQKARQEAMQLLDNSNSLIEKTIREIKEKTREELLPGVIRKDLESSKAELKKEFAANAPAEKPREQQLEPGCHVRITGQDSVGRLVEINKNKALVEFGELRTTVAVSKLERVENKAARKIKRALQGFDYNKEMTAFQAEIDVRGLRGDEALKETIAFIDKALILGFDKLRVLHGKGDGILRKLIRQELKKIPGIAKTEDEHVEFGGDGITVVYLE